MDWKFLFFGLDGRISRSHYWLGIVAILLATVLLYLAANAIGLFSWEEFADPQSNAVWINLIITLILLYPSLAVTVKRLHDRNRTGWWTALVYGLALLSLLFDLTGLSGTAEEPSAIGLALGAVLLVIGVWLLIELGFFKGSQGPNRFGPDPLGAKMADASL